MTEILDNARFLYFQRDVQAEISVWAYIRRNNLYRKGSMVLRTATNPPEA